MRKPLVVGALLLTAGALIQAQEQAPLELKMSRELLSFEVDSDAVVAAEAVPPEVPLEAAAVQEEAAAPEPLAPEVFKMSGYLEVGGMQHQLTQNYPDWNGQFLRGFLRTAPNLAWQLELLDSSQFSDRGTLLVLGNTWDINPDWYLTNSVATSSGGFFFPELKIDTAINRIWLDERNLVTSVGLGTVKAKDEHNDVGLMFSAAYHFNQPWVLEGGVRFNESNPGGVASMGKYVALTYGRDKESIISLRYGFGTEAYQTLGANVQVSNFESDIYTLTWRKWLRSHQGIQLRLETYKNPSYIRNGAEISLFHEF
jgi:YaiO family outer membrane protein